MTPHAWGAVLSGIQAHLVGVEVEVAQGLPSVGVIGLAHTAVGESRWRIRSAFGAGGIAWPLKRITINLSPADLPKRGAGLDLAIAVSLLRACELVPAEPRALFLGELGLDGSLRHIPGAIACAAEAARQGLTSIYLPPSAAAEAHAIPGITVIAVRNLDHCRAVLCGQAEGDPWPAQVPIRAIDMPDLGDVRGHAVARFGLEVAAAGNHHMCLLGPPGVGKTLLAERLPTVLPDLDDARAIEVTTIASLAGSLPPGATLVRRPPFQAPHHSATQAALLGTLRQHQVIPGAVTMAHGGVLFLDEAPEFTRPALEGLRQPLESGEVSLARAGGSVRVPADVQVVIAANPCPCGYAVDAGHRCACTPIAKRRYRTKLSGPLLDRIDVRLRLTAPGLQEPAGESSAEVGSRVLAARERARHRFRDESWRVNRRIPSRRLRTDFAPDDDGLRLVTEQDRLSMRGADRVARLAWSVCDLRGGVRPNRDDVATSLALRGHDELA